MNYFTNDMCRHKSVHGIDILFNTENQAIIGLDGDGLNLWKQIGDCSCPSTLNQKGHDLLEALLELNFISEQPYDIARHENAGFVSAYLHVTNKCNLHCVGCYSLDDKRNRAKDPLLENLKYAASELASIGVSNLVISGGEPFLRSDIFDFSIYVRECLSTVNHLSIITNGTVDADFSRLLGYVDEIVVSIDGFSPEHPTFIRDEGILGTILNTIEKIKQSGLGVSILPTLHMKNHEYVDSYIALSKQLGVPINFSILSVCETEQMREYIFDTDALEKLAASMFDVDLPIMDSPISFDLEACLHCGAGSTVISVAADGSVFPCHMLHDPKFLIGNVFEDKLETLVCNSSVIKELTGIYVDDYKECSKCEYKYFCGGGCRARSFYKTGEINHKDSYCEMSRKFYELAMEKLIF